MSDVSVFLRGVFLGFAIAAPVGPIGILCIRRTLADGRLVGFLSGLGAATADMLYGAVAAFGLTALQRLLLKQQASLQIIGGLFLLYLGLRTFITPPTGQAPASGRPRSRAASYLTTLGLTLTNPATILSFTVIFAGFRFSNASGSLVPPTLLVVGVFLGSAAWWLLLSGAVSLVRERFNVTWMRWINRVAGIVIFSFGVAALILR